VPLWPSLGQWHDDSNHRRDRDRRQRARRAFRPCVRSRRSERQQGVDGGGASLRCRRVLAAAGGQGAADRARRAIE
jgi:hypothetical protein